MFRISLPALAILGAALVGCGGASTRCARLTEEASVDEAAEPWAPTSVAEGSFIEQYAATHGFRLGQPASIRITPDESQVLFLRSGPRSFVRSLWAFDVASGEVDEVLTAEQLLGGEEEELSVEERARRERLRLSARGIAGYELSADGARILVPLSGRLFVVTRESSEVKELPTGEGYANDAHFSPDGERVAFVRDGDLYVIDVGGGRERRLTRTASETIVNGMPEFVAQEEMGRYRGYWWSPDGRQLLYQETDVSPVAEWHILDPMHPERPAEAHRYPRPGEANVKVRLGVISVTGGRTRWVDWDRDTHPYLATVDWPSDGPLSILVQNRLQNEEVLLRVDPRSGRTAPIHTERDEAWINLEQAMPRYLDGGESFLWSSERDGHWVLERRGVDGSKQATLTAADLGYEGLVAVDEDGGFAWVLANRGDPTSQHVVKVPLGGGDAVPMTEGRGLHDADVHGEIWVHTDRPLEGGLTFRVMRGSEEIGTLPSVAESLPFTPNVELLTVGERALNAVVVRPRNFEEGRSYPVLVSVYGGPHHRTVRASPLRYLREQWYADHGFIVVSADGRGTPGRGREFERAIYRDVISAPLDDQVAALTALGERVPEMDLSRVGIYGWSFGGYFSAHAVMQRPDVFHAGVAGAPVADWGDYDTHYTERYMGLPADNAEGYEHTSVLTHAPRLERPLLIIHGTADDNVYFVHAIKMSDALLRAGRSHDFLPLSGFTHMVAEPDVTLNLHRRIVGFLVDSLSR
jgi:dipeptidyl-peptidase-4